MGSQRRAVSPASLAVSDAVNLEEDSTFDCSTICQGSEVGCAHSWADGTEFCDTNGKTSNQKACGQYGEQNDDRMSKWCAGPEIREKIKEKEIKEVSPAFETNIAVE